MDPFRKPIGHQMHNKQFGEICNVRIVPGNATVQGWQCNGQCVYTSPPCSNRNADDFSWSLVVVHGRAWSWSGLGYPWSVIVGHGRSWLLVAGHGMVGHGRSWSVMVTRGWSWSGMVGHRWSWSVMVGHGRSWSVMIAILTWGLTSGGRVRNSCRRGQ